MKQITTLILICVTLTFNAWSQCSFTPTVTAVPVTSPGLTYNLSGTSNAGMVGYEYISVSQMNAWLQNPVTYTFPGSGIYTVCYYVYDSITMCGDSVCTNINVNGGGASACSVSYGYYVSGNGTYNFTAQSFVAPNSTTSFSWDFGDGNSGSGASVSHGFWAPGTYNVSVAMTSYNPADGTSCSDTALQTLTVTNTNNCNLQTYLNPQPDSLGSLNYMIVTAIINGSSNAQGTLDIQGGGTYVNQDTVFYTFPSAGNYIISFSASDSTMSGLCFDSTYVNVQAGSAAPNCSVLFNYSSAGNATFTFNAIPSAPSGWLTQYQWNFAPGVNAGGSTATYTFPGNGYYPVYLTMNAVNPNDSTATCQAYASDSVYVTNSNGSTCSVQLTGTFNGGASYTYDDITNSNYSSYSVYNSWSVDGQYYSSDTMITVTYSTSGNHTVCLDQWIIDNSTGDTCITTSCIQTSWYATCQAGFTMWEDSLNPGVYYSYNTSTGNNLTYLWNFGDGNTSTLAYPSHNYAVAGAYNICLTITDASTGCTSTFCDSVGTNKMMSSAAVSSFYVLAPTVGITAQEKNVRLNVAPNPLTENSSLLIESPVSTLINVSIVSLLGQAISSENITVSEGSTAVKLKTAALPSGIYFMQITENGKMLKTIKLVR